MGQKVNPNGFRLGVNKTWKSTWYLKPADYADALLEDLKIRKFISTDKDLQNADICDVKITRQPQKISVVICSPRVGVILGQKGANIAIISEKLSNLTSKKVSIKVEEVKNGDANAQLVAINVSKQLKGRTAFKKVLKQAVSKSMQSGALGIKIKLSGRLGGAEMARTEQIKEGRIPLHTLRANIDYGFAEADTTYGKIGVKVWIFTGFVYDKNENQKNDAGEVVKPERKPRRNTNA